VPIPLAAPARPPQQTKNMPTIFDEHGSPIYPFHKANSFPTLQSENLVDRSNFLETISRLLDETQVVFLEGDEGSGATTTAAQFCVANSESTFCLFVKSSSRASYSPEYLRLCLAEQILWYLDGKEYTLDSIDEHSFRGLLYRVRRKVTKKSPIYIVVDGLQKINASESLLKEILQDVLPLWIENVRFLICGKPTHFERFLTDISSKYIVQMSFSVSEAQTLLKPLEFDIEEVRTIHTMCKGIPGRIASVRRVILNGSTLSDILGSAPDKFPNFVKLEFSGIETLSDAAKKILALAAFSLRQLKRSELSQMVPQGDAAIKEVLSACPFMSDEGIDDRLDFVSDAHRRFAITVLNKWRIFAITEHINYLAANPYGTEAISYLPQYYGQLEQAAELIRFLTPEHFTKLLAQTSSLGALRERARIGMKASIKIEVATETLAFSLMQSIFLEIANSEGSNAEIRALVAMGQHQVALKVAFNCVTNEERLKFLATYAKKCRETSENTDPEVLSAIQSAAKAMDFKLLGDSAVDLAAELASVDQDLALSIIDDVVKGDNSKQNRDLAIARLSLETSSGVANTHKMNEGLSASKYISDAKLQAFVSSMIAVVSELSYEEILATCTKLDESRQLAFLGYWISEHRTSPMAADVVEHGLDLMIRNSTYRPKIREFAALAVALPSSHDANRVKSLVDRMDSQRGLIEDTSISIDLVSLQMSLAHAQMSYDKNSAAERVIECYYDLSGSQNADAKLEGFALMLKILKKIDIDGALETEHRFFEVIYKELSDLLILVLSNSADHFLIVKFVIRQFTYFDVNQAILLGAQLNTEGRRNQAFQEICNTLQNMKIDIGVTDGFLKSLSNITDSDIRDICIEEFLENISRRKSKLDEATLAGLETFLPLTTQLLARARSIIALIRLRHASETELESGKLLSELATIIPKLSASYHRSDLYFDACDAVAPKCMDQAREFYEHGIDINAKAPIATAQFAQLLTYCVLLCCRGAGASMSSGRFNEATIPRLLQLIELLPPANTRVQLITDLASRAWVSGFSDLARGLMGSHVLSIMPVSLPTEESDDRSIISTSFPLLYRTHQNTAVKKLALLQPSDRELAVMSAVRFIISQTAATDPDLMAVKESFVLNYADALDILTLLEYITDDWNIFLTVLHLSDSISSKINNLNFTGQQRTHIADSLKDICERMLPDKKNILHDGYFILTSACILRIRSNVAASDWEKVIRHANNISNIADRGFTLSQLSKFLPQKMHARQVELQTDALKLFSEVPSIIDKINRLISLSDVTSKDGIRIAKQSLKLAMGMTLNTSDDRMARDSRRRIIDIAERIDPVFADELAEMIDNDPARQFARSEVTDRLEMLAVKKKISNVKDPNLISKKEVQHLPEASWKNLSSLLAGRLEIISPGLMLDYLDKASTFELRDSYPIFAWFIENTGKKFVPSRDSAGEIKLVLDKLLLATEFAANVMAKISAKSAEFSRVSTGENMNGMLLGLNNRQQALSYLEDWLSQADEEIILCDPYFGAKDADLEFLRLVLRACPNQDLTIITSDTELSDQKVNSAESFLAAWHTVCDQAPPSTKIVMIGRLEKRGSAVHDRWLICGGRGLKLGTSFNGIGTGKLSAISPLTQDEVLVTARELRRFIIGERIIDGQKIKHSSFTV
jgi:hypothetical protein